MTIPTLHETDSTSEHIVKPKPSATRALDASMNPPDPTYIKSDAKTLIRADIERRLIDLRFFYTQKNRHWLFWQVRYWQWQIDMTTSYLEGMGRMMLLLGNANDFWEVINLYGFCLSCGKIVQSKDYHSPQIFQSEKRGVI